VKAIKLRYNELTMLLTTGLVRALSDSVNSKTANLSRVSYKKLNGCKFGR